ncbi:MAG: class I SAM-dependent methyltransferase [Candidatus Acidiferrum sp.]
MNETQTAQMNCDGIAPYYESLEHLSFGKALEKRRSAFLAEASDSRRALLCGGGDGRFLARLLCENTLVDVDFIDLSPKMIELARRRVAGMGATFERRVRFHTRDIRKCKLQTGIYDLIVTHFFLDCFQEQELTDVVDCLAGCGTADGKWILSEFREADGIAGRALTRALIRSLYLAFRVCTGLRVRRLPDYAAALSARGYRLRCEQVTFGGLLGSSLWQARKTGT